VAKPNYHHAKKQRELARKSRQNEKQQRRSARTKPADTGPQADPTDEGTAAVGTPGASGE
jgi:hypothetical protein